MAFLYKCQSLGICEALAKSYNLSFRFYVVVKPRNIFVKSHDFTRDVIGLMILVNFTIKTSGSESRGQEEAACMRVLGLCDHYSVKTSGSESRGQEEAACMRVLGLCDHYSRDER